MYSGTYENYYFFIIPIILKTDVKKVLHDEIVKTQVFNSELIAGYEHIIYAFKITIRAWKEKRNIAKSLPMELLLSVSATRQIKEALDKIGVKNEKCILIAFSEDKEKLELFLNELLKYSVEDESLIKINNKKIKKLIDLFKINEKEFLIAKKLYESEEIAIQSLVLEKIALFDLTR
jgi:KEOPS complex subunit Cgi121